METNFRIIKYGGTEWEKAVQLREEILRKPLGEIFSEKELMEEQDDFQVAGFLGGEIIATAVLVPEKTKIKMQRVVVKENYRNRNIGGELMFFCENFVKNNAYTHIYCHARDSAVNFYLKNDYIRVGDFFDEDGIPHLKMTKSL